MSQALRSVLMSAVVFATIASVLPGTTVVGWSQELAVLPPISQGSPPVSVLPPPLYRAAELAVENVPLADALTKLSERTGVEIAFSPSLVARQGGLVSCSCVDLKVGEALDRLLTGTAFGYTEVLSQVFVHLSEAPVIQDLAPFSEWRWREAAPLAVWVPVSAPTATSLLARSFARQAAVRGQVSDQNTGDPVSAVQVFFEGTEVGVLTGTDGSYALVDVQAGTYTLVAQRIGYQSVRQANVVVTPGLTTTVNLSISPTVLSLQSIVATGLVDPVEGARSPITVARVDRENLPVMASGPPLQTLRGMIPGVAIHRVDGQPGSEITLRLRTPTSVTQNGEPLVVVDGVILGSGMANIEAMDIESIEVIKGASAASLYGSRAAAGVIAITTTRGQGLALGETRISARSEMGRSSTTRADRLPTHHQYLMDEAQTTYVDQNGNPVPRSGRVAPSLAFMDKRYPGTIFDNVATMYQPGAFATHNFSIMQNTADTNFAITANRYAEKGPLVNNGGYTRDSFRVNLDHRLVESLGDMSVSVTVFHSRDWRDEFDANFLTMLRAPVDIDLSLKDVDGNYERVPDPAVAYENPLWTQASREGERRRIRTLAGANFRWEPAPWMSVVANVSYDRQDSKTRIYVPKGTPTSVTQDIPADGSLSYNTSLNDTWNSEGQVSFRRDFGGLNARTTARAILETVRDESVTGSGTNFFVEGVPRTDAAQTRSSTSVEQQVKAIGYLWDTALEYEGKYIGTVLFRRDGSSLFGSDNRWHGYYRTAFAWRMAEEDWFDVPNVQEFKLTYARGTAGGRPPFAAQYETWTVGASGISKGTLGNKDLRPEHTTEQELSLDVILFQRFGVDLTYAWQRTTDQLIQRNVPAVTGYSSQWANAAVVRGNTIEFSVEAQLMQTPRFGWTSVLVADRSRAWIAEWDGPCQTVTYRTWCKGYKFYTTWSAVQVEGREQLSRHHGGALLERADEFVVNDEGWLVWVGEGNHYTEGLSKGLWNTSTTIEGITYRWGIPFVLRKPDGAVEQPMASDGNHVSLGWSNNFRFGRLSFHTQLHAVVGREVVNQQYRSLVGTFQVPAMDQAGKPDELKKPMHYYTDGLEVGQGSRAWTDKGDYLKVRTLALSYDLAASDLTRLHLDQLGLRSLTFGLTGRDLFTLTNCGCVDPEQGLNLSTGQNWSGASSSQGGYPSSATITAEIAVTF